MGDNLEYWEKLNKPPQWALKTITGGRLRGKTDINPQWRYYVLTELFGPCGIGWKYTIDELWSVPANDGQVFAFAKILLYIKNGEWSEPIPGIGGSMLVEVEGKGKETESLHANDEGYKMAVTDALSTACKMLGVAGDIYMGLWDGAKYIEKDKSPQKEEKKPIITKPKPLTEVQFKDIRKLIGEVEGFSADEKKELYEWIKAHKAQTMKVDGKDTITFEGAKEVIQDMPHIVAEYIELKIDEKPPVEEDPFK